MDSPWGSSHNPGEHPLIGAIRELHEEAGIYVSNLASVGIETVKKGRKVIEICVYRAEAPTLPTTSVHDPDAEVTRWQWLTLPLDRTILDNLHHNPNVALLKLGIAY